MMYYIHYLIYMYLGDNEQAADVVFFLIILKH